MEVVTGAMHTLLPKLDTLLTGEYNLQRGLTGEIKCLKAELEIMQAALVRVSEAQMTDNMVKIWARSVREISYDIEDIIDTFMVHVEAQPSARLRGIKGFFIRSLGLLTRAKMRRRIAIDIKGIKVLVKEVAERRDRYRIDVVIDQPMAQAIDTRLHGMYEETTRLVAISGPTDELSSLLMEREGTSKRQLKVVSIVGVGGLGKTTLANVTYQRLRHQFDCDAFVSVSLKPDLKRILSSLLRQVSEEDYTNIETWEAEELINRIMRVLVDKRYIVIIDDIWDESAWKYIKCALVENNCGSRIITTTRSVNVAMSCCSDIDGTVYKLKPLLHDDSKQLFYKRVFGSEHGCHPELKETSEKILKKCGGVPLAIITIASLLANKPRNISEWNSVHNFIGSGLEKGFSMENMRQILSISYNDLPSILKPCLLYLSVFPEDYSIPTDQLVRRWIAEGFVHGQHDTVSLLQLGFSYFFELINRSMIQPEHLTDYESCRVHDMVLDLIKSLSTEENFVTTFDGYQHADLPEKVRRLSLQNNEEGHNLTDATLNLSHLRSVIVFPGATNLMPPLSNLPVLRVLDVEHCRDLENHHIAGVEKLFHLRYLGLRDTNVTKLPKEVGNLHCLHTLDLSHTSITELPSTAIRLKQLVRLYIEDSVKLPKGIGKLKLLQVLSSIGVSSSPDIVGELGYLTELRVLHISLISGTGTWCKSYEKPLLDSMFKLQKIQELHIQSFGVPTDFIADLGWFPQHLKDFLGGGISRLPSWMNSSLSNLYQINMSLYILRQEDLQNLGLIPILRYLYLSIVEIESTEERLVIGTGSSQFQCLYHLSFDSCRAMGLMFVQGALPNLVSLDITLRARETKDLYGDFNIGLENLCSVRKVSVKIRCTSCRRCEVDSAEADIRKAIVNNPNNPMFDITRCYEYELDEEQHHDNLEAIEEEEQLQIHLDPSEIVTEVSGTCGPFSQFPSVVTSLQLVTNLRSYGPFGQAKGTKFRTRVKQNGSIVGFFGRSTIYLDAIGVYVRP
ncbi:disease resistance protein RGA5-like isoform X3 [Oryza glaberrima]|uniref:disease resistance protein RGA5-like isoform X3 n=1 Tax=Oryza glaberrima TaxID=4538 RepID=UPI00224BFD2C|nr:disease resistance protein RGA5-like isoform X3 [Oryza glaberrima]